MTEQDAISYLKSICRGGIVSQDDSMAVVRFVYWLYNDGYKIESVLTGEDYAAQKKDLDRRIADVS